MILTGKKNPGKASQWHRIRQHFCGVAWKNNVCLTELSSPSEPVTNIKTRKRPRIFRQRMHVFRMLHGIKTKRAKHLRKSNNPRQLDPSLAEGSGNGLRDNAFLDTELRGRQKQWSPPIRILDDVVSATLVEKDRLCLRECFDCKICNNAVFLHIFLYGSLMPDKNCLCKQDRCIASEAARRSHFLYL